MKKFAFISLAFIFVSSINNIVFAHGGGLDSYGCHHNRKEGNYHCHRGDFAGRTFKSQAEMLKELLKLKSKI